MLGPIVMEINHLKTHQSPLDPFACHEARKIHASRGRRKRLSEWEKKYCRPDKVKSGVGEGNTQLLELITGAKFVHTLFCPYKRWYFLFLFLLFFSFLSLSLGLSCWRSSLPSCASYCDLLLLSLIRLRAPELDREEREEREREKIKNDRLEVKSPPPSCHCGCRCFPLVHLCDGWRIEKDGSMSTAICHMSQGERFPWHGN